MEEDEEAPAAAAAPEPPAPAAEEPAAPAGGGEEAAEKNEVKASIEGGCRRRLLINTGHGWGNAYGDSITVNIGRTSDRVRGHRQTMSIELGDAGPQDYIAVKIGADKHYGTPIFTTVGGVTSCPGETGTTKMDSHVTIERINYDYCRSPFCRSEPYEASIVLGIVVQNLSPHADITGPERNLATYLLFGPKLHYDFPGKCGDDGFTGGMYLSHVGANDNPLWYGYPLFLPYGQSEIQLIVETRWGLTVECLEYNRIPISIVSACEYKTYTYQYRTSLSDITNDVTVIHPVWDNVTLTWAHDTLPHYPLRFSSDPGFENRADSSYTRTFSVKWQAPAAEFFTEEVPPRRRIHNMKSTSSTDGRPLLLASVVAVLTFGVGAAVALITSRHASTTPESKKPPAEATSTYGTTRDTLGTGDVIA